MCDTKEQTFEVHPIGVHKHVFYLLMGWNWIKMLNFAKFQDMIVDCKKPIILPKYNKVIRKVPRLGGEFG